MPSKLFWDWQGDAWFGGSSSLISRQENFAVRSTNSDNSISVGQGGWVWKKKDCNRKVVSEGMVGSDSGKDKDGDDGSSLVGKMVEIGSRKKVRGNRCH